MLAAKKHTLTCEIKRQVLELKAQELGIYVTRYTNLASIAALSAGFTLNSMAEFRWPEHWDTAAAPLATLFFAAATTAFCSAIHVTAVASFAVVNSHSVALLGTEGDSIDTAVEALKAQERQLYFVCSLGSFCLVVAVLEMLFLAAHIATSCTACSIMALGFLVLAVRLFRLRGSFSAIDKKEVRPEVPAGLGPVEADMLIHQQAPHFRHSEQDQDLLDAEHSIARRVGFHKSM